MQSAGTLLARSGPMGVGRRQWQHDRTQLWHGEKAAMVTCRTPEAGVEGSTACESPRRRASHGWNARYQS
jgi:hypothetical protein